MARRAPVSEQMRALAQPFDVIAVICKPMRCRQQSRGGSHDGACCGQLEAWPEEFRSRIFVYDIKLVEDRIAGLTVMVDRSRIGRWGAWLSRHGRVSLTYGWILSQHMLGVADNVLILEGDYEEVEPEMTDLHRHMRGPEWQAFVRYHSWDVLRLGFAPPNETQMPRTRGRCPLHCTCVLTTTPLVCEIRRRNFLEMGSCDIVSTVATAFHRRSFAAMVSYATALARDWTNYGATDNRAPVGIDRWIPGAMPRVHYLVPGAITEVSKAKLHVPAMRHFSARCVYNSSSRIVFRTGGDANASSRNPQTNSSTVTAPTAALIRWDRATTELVAGELAAQWTPNAW